MNKSEAIQIDKGFYVEYDEDSKLYCVFGDNSGFAYSTHASEESANNALEEKKRRDK